MVDRSAKLDLSYMLVGKRATAGLAAKVMSQGIEASSSSKELRSKKDGDPKSCSGATRDDEGPPGGCGALIRVTMAPIEGGTGPDKGDNIAKTGVDDGAGCPKGFAYTDEGVCVKDASTMEAGRSKR